MHTYDIVAAGHICLDISPAFACQQTQTAKELFLPGRLITLDGVTISAGGTVSNTGFAMARLGLGVRPMACIGDDQFGSMLSDIAGSETGAGIICRPGARTSYSIVLSPPGIDRIILHDPAGNDLFTADDIDYGAVAKSKCFHFGYPPLMKAVYDKGGSELTRIFSLAKKAGAITSLDMSLPDAESESGRADWHKILQSTLPFVDLFFPSVQEALFMLDRAEYDRVTAFSAGDDFTHHLDFSRIRALGETILDMGARMAFIKCGAHGVYIKTSGKARMEAIGKPDWAGREVFMPTYHVPHFASALGGGDTTIAGFLSGFLREFDLFDSARIACQTGALCCASYDTLSNLRPVEQVYALIKSQPRQNETSLPAGHLRYDEKEGLFWA